MAIKTPHISAASMSAFTRNLFASAVAIAGLCGMLWLWVGPTVTEWLRKELSLPANLAEDLARIQDVQGEQVATSRQLTEVQQQQQQSLSELSNATATITKTLESTVTRIASLEASSRRDARPPIRFIEDGNSIGSGSIGDYVRLSFRYVKVRDCGRPVLAAYFRDGADITQAFRDMSSVAADGRGSSAMVSPEVQTTRFIARIPREQGVVPAVNGKYALGWVLISWPGCPDVPEQRSPQVPFQITP